MAKKEDGDVILAPGVLYLCEVCKTEVGDLKRHLQQKHQMLFYEYLRLFPNSQVESRYFTPERGQAIVDYVQNGLTLSQAAAICRLDVAAVQAWLRDGEGDKSDDLHRFYLDVLQAETNHFYTHLNNIQQAGAMDWRASNAVLQARHKWVPIQKHEVEQQTNGMIQLQWSDRSLAVGGTHGGEPIEAAPDPAALPDHEDK